MLQASLVFSLLQWLYLVQALQSKQRKVLETDVNRVDLNLCTKNVYANLGGQGGVNVGETGPGDKTEDGEWRMELRYKRVASLPSGEILDLVVTNVTEYHRVGDVHPITPALFGDLEELKDRKGCMGTVSLGAPGKVKLKFAMVLHGTDTPAPKSTYEFTMIDKTEYRDVTEPVKVGEFLRVASAVGAVEVPSTEQSLRIAGSQLTSSVGFVFENVDHWQIGVGATDSATGVEGLEVGRKVFFAGRTSLHSKIGKSKERDGASTEIHDTKEPHDTKELRDAKDSHDTKRLDESKEPYDAQESNDTKNESKDTKDESHDESHEAKEEFDDIKNASHDAKEEYNDTKNESNDKKDESHDARIESNDTKEESNDTKEESNDTKEESHDGKEESHKAKEESHDAKEESHDAKEDSDDTKEPRDAKKSDDTKKSDETKEPHDEGSDSEGGK